MTTPGDDNRTPPPSSPQPPDPFQHPSGGHVERPKFGDGSAGQFAPDYDAMASPGNAPSGPTDRPPAPQPPPPDPAGQYRNESAPSQPIPPPPSVPIEERESRRGLIAPIAAGVVLIGGIGLLFAISGSDEPETTTGPRIAEVRDPDEPLVESTVPFQTSPPLIEPTTTVDDVTDSTVADTTTTTTTGTSPTTVAPGTGGPTMAQLDTALLGLDDIGPGDWTEELPEFDEVCGTVPDEEVTDARADSLFQTVVDDPFSVRQISNTLITFPTAEIAELAFNGDVALLVACDASTVELGGIQYRAEVETDSFSEEEAVAFPCADQSSFLILQLTNESAIVPYIGQSAVSFRCGRNITVTALTTTIDIDDLNDEDYFNAAGISNVRVGALPGS